MLHSGLLRHNGKPDRGHAEVQSLDAAQFPLGEVRAKVALLHDYESLWLYNAQPHTEALNYWAQTFTYYRVLRSLGMDVDILHPDSDLDRYALVVAPALTLMTPQRARHLEAAAERRLMVFGPRTAFRTAAGGTPDTGQFGDLSALTGAESYDPGAAQVLYRYHGGPLGGEAAVIRNGNVTVIGAHSETLITELLEQRLSEAELSPVRLPEGVRLSRRGDLTLLQNWNARALSWQGQTLAPVSARSLAPSEVTA